MSETKQNKGESNEKKSASSDRPPRPQKSITSSKSASSDGVSTSRRPSNSNTPSRSATNESGEQKLNNHLCSILFHPLGLPLAYTLHGMDPAELDYLSQTSNYFPKNKKAFDNVLGDVLAAWKTKVETDLTTALAISIDSNKKIPLRAERDANVGNGRVDILLRKNKNSRPLMLVEVGLISNNWWLKFDQCVKYLNTIQRAKPPLLLGIVTVAKGPKQDVEVKLGVFLCLWNGEKEKTKSNVRISLLWHSKTCNREQASKAFGRLLRGVCDFSSWIKRVDSEPDDSQYEYFGSNCCKVGDMVLRSYDDRYRKTHRSPEIYLNKDCKDIVGEGAKIIFTVPVDESSWNIKSDDFWEPSRNRSLRVIVTPFRPGCHYAKEPKSFLPIIEELVKLHNIGYVHGDIRGFNTVFGEDSSQGYLIDFDFGGEAGKRVYPKGYRTVLADGTRIGEEGESIEIWHDWYGLGQLIFYIHKLNWPEGESQSTTREKYMDLFHKWQVLSNDPTSEMIDGLKEFLKNIQDACWTVQTSPNYCKELKKLEKPCQATKPCATGSPP